MNYQRELQVALEAAARASRLILEHYASLVVIPDAPADISTETDRQSQRVILNHIHETFPEDALCAEESTPEFAGVPSAGLRLWVVDPIDGTRGFARKNGEFSVMVAFVDRGQAAVGVVLEPAKQRLTWASLGDGCWRRDGKETGAKPCRVTATRSLSECTITQSHSKDKNRPSSQIRALGPARVIETYSAGIKLAQVARGDADIYLNTYDAPSQWDVCAGEVLVKEAGGRVTSLLGEVPRYGQHGFDRPRGLLASNGLLHEPALAALRTVC
jgi:3'(2'), 5'-bisphosphate nucleotidase